MRTLHTIKDVQEAIAAEKKAGKSIGLVPTMGALHQGHLSLIKRCKTENDICVVSVFVNPTQFNNKQDLETYPRDTQKDAALLESADCDIMFAPTPEDMYSQDEMSETFSFDFGGLDKVMEGKLRPGHFNGVVQVVSKLFKIVTPRRAYFGLKDFQQVAIIRHMTRKMKLPVEIIECPIVREASGLAFSSRNQLLSDDERKKAVTISKVLKESINFVPQKSPRELITWVTDKINSVEGLEVEYFEVVDGDTLKKISDWNMVSYVVGCITVYCGKIRLIDNIRLK